MRLKLSPGCSHAGFPEIRSTPGEQQINWAQLLIHFRVLILPALLFVCCACWFHPGLSTSKGKNSHQHIIYTQPQHVCWEGAYRHVWSAVQINCQHCTRKTVRRLKKKTLIWSYNVAKHQEPVSQIKPVCFWHGQVGSPLPAGWDQCWGKATGVLSELLHTGPPPVETTATVYMKSTYKNLSSASQTWSSICWRLIKSSPCPFLSPVSLLQGQD